ncbi:hypothetical protein F9802_08745 [Bacillus aerolatus]|uniref:SLH domain-containing protein n=1 Tax=Bacillus aerolatus TaxID=2653354 RepID=A0A6I1FLI0_9BACI|nr:Ig-like domain-containing protein [Bacillus aerolatus]KAB7707089.1 hypothetical protein F9802_08745 [Bacillus aerolatus]
MFKQRVRAMIAFTLIIAFSLGDILPVLASTDLTPPTLKSIKLDKTAVQPGDEIHIQVEAEDLESGISDVTTHRVVQVKKQGGDTDQYVYLTYNSTTKKYEGTYRVPSNAINGTWYTSWIYFVDKVGNQSSLFPREGSNFYQTFSVSNGSNDLTPPTLKSIKLDKTAVQPGDEIHIQVEAEDLESGISDVTTHRVVQVKKQGGDTDQYVYLTYNSTTKKYEGTYRVPSNAINGVWYTSWVYFVDKVGNQSSLFPREGSNFYQTFIVSNDIVPPNSPIVNEVSDNHTSVTGTAEVGSIVTIKAGATVLTSVTVGTDGKFTATIPVQKAGTKLTVTATDKVGNMSEAKEVIVKDATAPGVPSVSEITEKSTNVTGTAEAGSTVTVKAGTTVLTTVSVDADGKFTATIPVQKAGTKLTITATDKEGNISEAKEVIVKDATAPGVPDVNEVTEKSTNVTGTAEAGSTVTVKAGTTVLTTVSVDADGKFTATIPVQKAGTKLTITATDKEGNISEAKEVIVKDATAPGVPDVNEVTEKSTSVTGTAEAGSTVTVKTGTTVLTTVSVDADGKFIAIIPVQKAGTKLTITATDKDGNISEAKEVIVKDVTAPGVPNVNEVTEKSTSVAGTAEAGSTVTVKAGTTVLTTVSVDADGKFIAIIPVQKAGTKLTITATDKAGNISEAKEVTVKQVASVISFSDVLKSERFYNEIYTLSNEGIITGFPDGTFRPNTTVTRAQAAIMIGRALELTIDSTETTFNDVSSSSKAAGYIAAAYKSKIITGFPDGTFRPDETVTRGQMAIFLARAFKLQDTTKINFSDVAENMAAYESIKRILAAQITVGYPDNTFKPTADVTRGQFSAFLTRALQKAAQ